MIVKNFITGPLATNSYLLISENEGVIIDAGGDMKEVLDFIRNNKVKLRYIIATHGHFDHVMGINEIKREFPSSMFLINERDLGLVKRASTMASSYLNLMISDIINPDGFIKEGDEINVGNRKLKIIETPGHTMGSICILANGYIFTGDTLFYGTVGRTDIGGSEKLLRDSLERLKKLPDELIVYPGHGPFTILGYEKIKNPFLTIDILP
ncbi:MBL fold metallo-hydrolase [Sulfolobus sp. A20]|uniref:MBL fold metallo-hydrolase n=1 Tax=Sulfolobaceae TaxID=118883 RepID=UPI000845CFB4|nr:MULTISPECIES: MBL fold metallo-hydrolase [unclassified Sulfolobus]TRM76823.1 MBL fold metallo-hydrolase [Sulfolobus sp. E5]TRM77475.1 MBL fold metallo-hydrolase [Sulfolobus sp. B5]TRM84279.1 MBL fold metallo-hydrolase [Sulfolobus sp. A20-N-F6]TRM84763.1 MBL fold metallo-hydrolase [Sulfolobus sp. F3]TRM89637.1 MBL fold metallo-hydrolase [Sulfolobus sp. C3]TRM94721.1 MBL fold metallo-hydrolase [Sulfolobus sp. A20-N-G8]TRN02736.1 MBL fold metallo-hydrolase [Sulfolobus sp. F1]TRN04723.1 MBL 